MFELVNAKQSAKPKKKRREMTPEQKAKAAENLRKGREKSLATRRANAAAKAAVKNQDVPAQPPVPVPVQNPKVSEVIPVVPEAPLKTSATPSAVLNSSTKPSAVFETSAPVKKKGGQEQRVSYADTVKSIPEAEPKPVVKEEPKLEQVKTATKPTHSVSEPDEDNTPHAYITWQGGNLW